MHISIAKKNWLALLGLAFLLSCSPADKPTQEVMLKGKALGANYEVKLYATEEQLKGHNLYLEVAQKLDVITKMLSNYDAESEISRFNSFHSTDKFEASPAMVKLVSQAKEIGEFTQGRMDITVGPLVNLWGFGAEARPDKIPTDEEIQQSRDSIGLDKLIIESRSLQKTTTELYVDLGAVSQGYAADRVGELLERKGIHNYLVSVGGETRVRGKKPDGSLWQIALDRPLSFTHAEEIVLTPGDMSFATSGNYRHYFEEDGVRFSHTIDPKHGRPIQHKLVSVSVFHKLCVFADGYATAINVMGPEEGMAFAEKHNLPVLMTVKLPHGFEQRMSSSFKNQFGSK